MQFLDSIADGGKWVWGTLVLFGAATVASAMLLTTTATLRYERDVNRMVFNDNLGVLEEIRGRLGESEDSLARLGSQGPVVSPDQPYIVVSIADRELWYKRGDSVLFHTQ